MAHINIHGHINIHSQHPPKPTSVRFTELFIKEELTQALSEISWVHEILWQNFWKARWLSLIESIPTHPLPLWFTAQFWVLETVFQARINLVAWGKDSGVEQVGTSRSPVFQAGVNLLDTSPVCISGCSYISPWFREMKKTTGKKEISYTQDTRGSEIYILYVLP